MAYKYYRIPLSFIWRRLHSLMGLWLVLFLIIHLFSNSQAALLAVSPNSGFIKTVNDIQNLPYLPVIEIAFLAVPFFIHLIWGVQYALTGKINSYTSDGSHPSLPEYPRNHAYTWQRLTSWVLIILIAAHVFHMRFLEYPSTISQNNQKKFVVHVRPDEGLKSLAKQLNVELLPSQMVQNELNKVSIKKEKKEWAAVSNNFGTAVLLMVRETFKKPVMLILYTLLVLFTCFHAFNGLWTSLIKWGVTLSPRSQALSRYFSTALMLLIAFLGLAAIWGTFWMTLS